MTSALWYPYYLSKNQPRARSSRLGDMLKIGRAGGDVEELESESEDSLDDQAV